EKLMKVLGIQVKATEIVEVSHNTIEDEQQIIENQKEDFIDYTYEQSKEEVGVQKENRSTLVDECRTEIAIDDLFAEEIIEVEQRWETPEERTESVAKSERLEEENKSIEEAFVALEYNTAKEDIAIIGISGRYPMAQNVNEFWKNLKNGKNCITEIPKERWNYQDYYFGKGNPDNIIDTKWGGFIEDMDKFDALFFHIAPSEAEKMDPQERIFMETVWNAIEDAGLREEELGDGNRAGLFVGVMNKDYEIDGAQRVDKGRLSNCHSFYWSFANRISHFLNMQGPSIAVDTACSASLVAVHLAAQSIHSGDCDFAIAGGVNLILHPSHLEQLSQTHQLSQHDCCMCFSEQGDGMLIGEGTGAVVLKKLNKAKADGDHIYGVIKGSSIYSSGRTSHYMVQNPAVQATLILNAYKNAGIPPRTISYIEAQATGSHDGDATEMNSMIQAFRENTSDKQFCAVGSVKSNIGHLEPASGIAALTKVLLQMKYKQLVPTINAEQENQKINFTDSSFYLQKQLSEWKQPYCNVNGEEKPMPRRAGISSFGAGGVDVHVVIEEYQENNEVLDEGKQIIVLSARNQDGLRRRASELLEFLEFQMQISMSSLAYTLQIGRREMDFRLAFVASNIEEVKAILSSYLAGEDERQQYYFGNVKKATKNRQMIFTGRAGKAFLSILQEDGELEQLACLWTEGIGLDWNLIHRGKKPRKIALPGYPFMKKRYWRELQPVTEFTTDDEQGGNALLENKSSLYHSCFIFNFEKSKHYIRDHKVNGNCIVPAAVLLNMIYATGEQLWEQAPAGMKDIALMASCCVEKESLKGEIALKQADKYLEYQLMTENRVNCMKGKLYKEHTETLKKMDLPSRISQFANVLDQKECYSLYKEMGFSYGQYYQSIKKLYYNKREAIAELSLTEINCMAQEFSINPAVIDGMIQSVLGILYANNDWKRTYMPFFIGHIEVLRKLTGNRFYARAERVDKTIIEQGIHFYDLELYLDDGSLAIAIRNYAGKMKDASSKIDTEVERQNVEYLIPVLKETAQLPNEADIRSILVIEENQNGLAIEDAVAHGKSLDNICYFVQKNIDGPENARKEAWRFASVLKEIVKKARGKESFIVLIYSGNQETQSYAAFKGLSGIARTAMEEYPNLSIKLVTIPAEKYGEDEKETIIRKELAQKTKRHEFIVYDGVTRWCEFFECTSALQKANNISLRKDGVYVITGGLGGVGTQLAEYLAMRCRAVIVTGRSQQLTDVQNRLVKKLNSYCAEVEYQCCDCTNGWEVKESIAHIISKYGQLNGLIHAAGVVADGLLLRKEESEFHNVCKAKTDGIWNLDHNTKDCNLDFFVDCSSISAIMGNAGQSDYAYANHYMDTYMAYRNQLVKKGERSGRSLSINWPYWREGGLYVSEETQKKVIEMKGLSGISTQTGIAALLDGIQSEEVQMAVVTGAFHKIHQTFGINEDKNQGEMEEKSHLEQVVDSGQVRSEIMDKIFAICAKILKVDRSDLDIEEELDNYGLDSIMMITFMQMLEEQFDEILEPNFLITANTIQKLTDYFYNKGSHEERSQDVIKIENSYISSDNDEAVRTLEYRQEHSFSGCEHNVDAETFNEEEQHKNEKNEKVAIIGMSCRYPKSNSLEEYWSNLINGKNMITEVTKDRWDISKHYSEDKSIPNKSYSKYAGFLDDIYGFDADYFGISEEEAAAIDPYHRIMLELSDELFKRAGYQQDELNGSATGVYIGGGESNYFSKNFEHLAKEYERHIVVNTIPNMMAARISDYYNLKGPAECVDTACSSSMVALHHACQGITSGDCDMAIVGGIELILNEYYHVAFSKAGILTKGKEAYVFDERADGTVLGEGAGLVLIKSYEKAVKDGDQILAVIESTAVNNDGHTMGLTVPSMEGQKAVIEKAIERSGISPRDIVYLETHGTGTLLGDPIEIKAASDVFRKYTDDKQFCAVGSVKSNMGHLLRGAGIAGLIKIVLSLQNKMIPPTLNCTKPHPRFQFAKSPFYPITEPRKWEDTEQTKYEAISAFGFGGTNCHAILGEFKAPQNYQRRREGFSLGRFSKKQYRINSREPEGNETVGNEMNYRYGEAYLEAHQGDNPFEDQNRKPQVLLGVTLFAMAADVAVKRYPAQVAHVQRLFLSTPVTVYPSENVTVKIMEHGEHEIRLRGIIEKSNGEVFTAMEGVISSNAVGRQTAVSISKLLDSFRISIKKDRIYTGMEALRGEALQTIDKLYIGEKKSAGELILTEEMRGDQRSFRMHPAFLDAGFMVAFRGMQDTRLHEGRKAGVWIPVMAKDFYLYHNVPERCICQAELVSVKNDMTTVNLIFVDYNGVVLAELKEFSAKYVYYGEKSSKEPVKEASVKSAKAETITNKSVQIVVDNKDMPSVKTKIKAYLAGKISEHLEEPSCKLNTTTNFMELGIDSTSLIALAEEIEKEIEIELYPTIFFEYQNIEEMTEYFSKEHKEAFDKYLATQLSNMNEAESSLNEAEKPNIAQNKAEERKEEKAVYVEPLPDSSEMMHEQTVVDKEPVAIIGMSGRFSGVGEELEDFWNVLKECRSEICQIPGDHWDVTDWYDTERSASSKTYSKWGSFIEVDTFDPAFFGISPREAVWMDPQLRLLMETVYHTLEDAGYAGKVGGTQTGMFVGCCLKDYWEEILRRNIPIADYQANSSLASSLSGRLSYLFDLHAVSMTIDHACASSLSAVHMACKAIQQGECDMAVAAGVNLLLSPIHYVNASKAQALSPTGRCHSFDESADGYVPGEGVGALLLKPLSKAIADGDRIHAVIRGSATNHNGKANNPTSPRMAMQVELLKKAWKDANIDPSTITYVEAHGTGTKIGDPIEMDALKQAFREYTANQNICAVGTVKSNLGHLEGAAGIAGVIKTILCMKHKCIVKMPEFHRANPYLKLADAPIYINEQNQYWETEPDTPRRAGVSAFGLSGHNTHVVLEEYPVELTEAVVAETASYACVLSAKNEQKLRTQAKNMLRFVMNAHGVYQLRDICYTLACKRESMDKRFGCIISSLEELEKVLQAYLDGEEYREETVQSMQMKKALDDWIAKKPVNWEQFYAVKECKVLTLPLYPFAKEHYWMPRENRSNRENVVEYFDTKWIEKAVDCNNRVQRFGKLLVIDRHGDIKLPSLENAIVVRNAEEGTYHVNLGDIEDYRRLFQDISQGGMPQVIVYVAPIADIGKDQKQAVMDFFALLKGMPEENYQSLKQIVIVYKEESSLGNAANEALAAFGLSLGAVLNQVRVKTIAIGQHMDDKVWDCIENESCNMEPIVRYLDGKRLVRRLRRLELTDNKESLFRKNGTYLITGGLGGLGVLFAKAIYRQYTGRIVLLGRSKLNEQKEALLEEMRRENMSVAYYSVDVTDSDAIKHVIEIEKANGYSINGVIHSAGIASNGSVLDKSIQQFEAVLHP
ncbi:MAG: SDR family NAD(P)-dependent oxidoreductase, partial [Clostridium sp.]|nr:SDR family NAD(P)-dependent oxidoreductase [Clostridium sp.]